MFKAGNVMIVLKTKTQELTMMPMDIRRIQNISIQFITDCKLVVVYKLER